MIDSVEVQPIRRAYEQVADQLRAQILDGTLAPGDRLPLEAKLANDFGVSRATVREALRSLAAEGLIRTTKGPGGGSFVTLPTLDNISDFVKASLALLTEAQSVTLEDFLEVREMLESRAARLAAERHTEAALERLRLALPPEPFSKWSADRYAYDRGFHAEVMGAAGNMLLAIAAHPVFAVLQDRFERGALSTKTQRAIDEQHRELAAIIESGDGDAAEAAMRAHLEYLRPAYERAWRKTSNGRSSG
jgi:GntR family transcriptional repressor for pyruvate dehydrogenase complex